MKNRFQGLALVLGLAVVLMLAQILVGQAPAQGGGAAPGGRGGGGGRGGAPAAPAGPIVRGPDGKPDMTGYWMSATKTNINSGAPNMGIINPETGMPGAKIPYNAEWEAKAADTTKNHMFDEPYAHCLPAGVPTNFGIQMGFQAVQDKNSIVFAWDTAGSTRIIYTDDRKHVPANIRLYQGDSVGHWEGDTLVVDTTSQAAGWWDANGAVHSDQTHVVEKFTPKDANNIAYEAVVEDPVALTRPMTVVDTFRRNVNVPQGFKARPTGYEQTETACIEGEQDTILYPESGGGFAKDGTPGAGAPAGALTNAGRGGGGGGGGAPGGGRGGRGGGPGGPPAGGPPPQQ